MDKVINVFIAKLLPDALIYWCARRLVEASLTGRWCEENPYTITAMESLSRWGMSPQVGECCGSNHCINCIHKTDNRHEFASTDRAITDPRRERTQWIAEVLNSPA